MGEPRDGPPRLPSAGEDLARARRKRDTSQTRSPSYRLAFADEEFLLRDELRPVRLQLELLKPELLLREHRIDSTVVVFGSARIPAPEAAGARARRRGCVLDPERTYAAAREFARLVSRAGQIHGPMPILLFDERYWRRIVNFDAMVEEGVISLQDRDLVRYVKSAEAAWRAICAHYGIDPALADEGS